MKKIATEDDVMEFLSQMMWGTVAEDETVSLKERLRSAELLLQCQKRAAINTAAPQVVIVDAPLQGETPHEALPKTVETESSHDI